MLVTGECESAGRSTPRHRFAGAISVTERDLALSHVQQPPAPADELRRTRSRAHRAAGIDALADADGSRRLRQDAARTAACRRGGGPLPGRHILARACAALG